MNSFFYFVKQAFINFRRNFSTGAGAVITIFLAMFIIGLFLFVNDIIDSIASSVEDEVSITCYVSDSASQDIIDQVMTELRSNDLVSTVSFTDKDQALDNFKNSLTTNTDIIDALDGDNPLPASIDVQLNNAQDVETVAAEILADPTYLSICDNTSNPSDSVKYGQQTVEKLFTITNTIRYAGLTVVLLLVFVTLVFINNTIRLAIVARRKEIAIMRLVGASNGFIRGPFLMEGALQSIIGACLAVVALDLVNRFALPKLQSSITWLPIDISSQTFTFTALLIIGVALLIGLLGSAFAMRRYLKV
jgi:cell division transport system permease protein